jgi:hypothetical protein
MSLMIELLSNGAMERCPTIMRRLGFGSGVSSDRRAPADRANRSVGVGKLACYPWRLEMKRGFDGHDRGGRR